MAAGKAKEPEPLRKITVATVFGAMDDAVLERLLKDKARPVPVMDIWGIATKAKPGESDYGPFVKFLGQFRAVNLDTGEMFRAPTCLLPKFLEEDLYGSLSAAGVSQVEFGFRLSAKYDAKAATKYVYLAENLIEPAKNDALDALESRMADARKALPAPKK